jgi:methylated-DNA-[protein]-cysteine S-methyltransferase
VERQKEKTFDEQSYEQLSKIPKGKVSTYQEIARALGVKAYRAVGQAMNRNQNLINVHCHRVVKSNGEVGGYALGQDAKIQLLKKEGVEVDGQRVVDY